MDESRRLTLEEVELEIYKLEKQIAANQRALFFLKQQRKAMKKKG